MDVVINSVTTCAGGNHITFDMSVDGKPVIKTVTLDQLNKDPSEEDAAIHSVLQHLVKESAVKSPAELKTLVEGTTIKI